MARLGDPRGPVHVHAVVAAAGQRRLSGVDSHAHAEAVVDQRPLRLDRRDERLPGLREDVRCLVPERVQDDALAALDRLPEQVAVAPEGDRVLGPERLHEPGRALDVGEEQRDFPARELGHRMHGISATIRVPSPTGLSTWSRPSSASTRSTRPRRPDPRVGSAPPTPSSAISTTALAVPPLDADPGHGRLRVLADVRERLRDHVEGGGLDRRRQPLLGHGRDLDRRRARAWPGSPRLRRARGP